MQQQLKASAQSFWDCFQSKQSLPARLHWTGKRQVSEGGELCKGEIQTCR